MSRLDAVRRILEGLDPGDRARLATDEIASMNGDQLAQVGVAMVRRCDALARTEPAAADRIAQATMATWRDLDATMSGSLSAAIDEAP